MAWLSGWSYRKEITITGQSGAGTNFQVLFDIGDSAGGDFHLEGHCTNFPQDIAVTDNDETTLLDFWIEDITADPLKMWVEVADDLGTNQTIYVYYGKSGATTDSDIENTFLLGDHFPGSSLDTSKWNSGGTVSVTDSKVTCSGTNAYISGKTSYGQGHAIRGYGKLNKGTADEAHIAFKSLISYTNGIFLRVYFDEVDDKLRLRSVKDSTWGTGVYSVATNEHTYRIFELQRKDASTYYGKINDETVTGTTQVPTVDLPANLYSKGSSNSLEFDWIVVRKYNSPEPAFSSAGSEETPPIGVSPTSVFYGPLYGPMAGPIGIY